MIYLHKSEKVNSGIIILASFTQACSFSLVYSGLTFHECNCTLLKYSIEILNGQTLSLSFSVSLSHCVVFSFVNYHLREKGNAYKTI